MNNCADKLNNIRLQIIMPCFNAAPYLSQALDSLLTQTFSQWQLLIIDDGSTDNSLQIIQQYANRDQRIIWRTRENRGLISTLNELVEWSNAPLLARMDADDLSMPDRFEKQLAFMQRNPNVDMVGCWAELFGNKQETWHFRESDNNTRILSLFGRCCMLHASVIAKREVFETVPFNPDYKHLEDYVFLSDIITKTGFKFGNVRKILYRYRMHTNSVVQKHQAFRKKRYQQTVLQHLQNLGLPLSEADYQDYWHFVEGTQASFGQLLRIGRLLAFIRNRLQDSMPDEHHEIAFRWLTYCEANQHPELYGLCSADNVCFIKQKTSFLTSKVKAITDVCTFFDLNGSPWVLLGAGGYAKSVIEKCQQLGVRLPAFVVTKNLAEEKLFCGIPLVTEQSYDFASHRKLVFGSNVYQMAILSRINHLTDGSQCIYDCSSALWDSRNAQYFSTPIEPSSSLNFVIIFDINPVEHIETWLIHFITCLEKDGVQAIIRHPLQAINDSLLLSAGHIFIWNGAVPVFDAIKMRLAKLAVQYDYLECGFFPQKQYFYIDRAGINNQRGLATDRLLWVDEKMHSNRLALRQHFFADYYLDTDDNYIFVPLQLANDSNVQRNSRFTNGMQEFINFIEDMYPSEKVIFKKHPKDPAHYHSIRGEFSTQDSRQLISRAKHVHGINSTVLFEAALAGKSVSAEGECLLNHNFADTDTVVTAMIATQYPVEGPFNNYISELKAHIRIQNKTIIKGVYE